MILKDISFILTAALFLKCGVMPDSIDINQSEIEINALISRDNLYKNKETVFDSLVIEINGNDMESIRKVKIINSQNPVIKDTIKDIPAGKNREIKIYTVNNSGLVIHKDSVSNRIIDIDPKSFTIINAILIPAYGSIYIQIGGVSTDIDSIFAIFTSTDSNIWETKIKRSPKSFINIDNIPNGTTGIIEIYEINNSGDTLYYASKSIKIDATNNKMLNIKFNSVSGNIETDIKIIKPGLTIISIGNEKIIPADTESGEIIISEIMYAANYNEYIEIYNPKKTKCFLDTLYIDIDGKYYLFKNIEIKPEGFYIIGRKKNSWNDQFDPDSSLDLSKTGNWVTLRKKDYSTIDQVIFTGESNGLEWPKAKGNESIILKKEYADFEKNNYGRNWSLADNLIDSTMDIYGTPHLW